MVKTLMKQIKEYKKDSLLTMLFATLEVILNHYSFINGKSY